MKLPNKLPVLKAGRSAGEVPKAADYWRLARHSGIRRAWNHFCEGRLFDLLKGTNTAHWKPKVAYVESLPSFDHGYLYEATHTSQIIRCIRAISDQVRLPDYAFYDLGCGKGKVLICAERFGFSKIVGVEYDPSLVDIAKSNILRCGASSTVVCGDVGEYNEYASQSVLYLYNPFDEIMLRRIIEKIAATTTDAFIIYTNPIHDKCLNEWELIAILDGPSSHYRSKLFRRKIDHS